MSKAKGMMCGRIAAAVFLGVAVGAGAAASALAEPKSPTGSGTTLCKEKCEKSCMGNDTPTERSNCLQREKCSERPACPTEPTAPPPKRVDPGSGTPKPPKTYQVPKGNTGGVLQQ
jgi:hypothetical protein